MRMMSARAMRHAHTLLVSIEARLGDRGDGVRRGARDVTSGARASSVGTGGRCVRESAREWSKAGREKGRGGSRERRIPGRGSGQEVRTEGDEGRWDEVNPLHLLLILVLIILLVTHTETKEEEEGGKK